MTAPATSVNGDVSIANYAHVMVHRPETGRYEKLEGPMPVTEAEERYEELKADLERPRGTYYAIRPVAYPTASRY